MASKPPSYTPTSGDVYMSTPEMVLVTKDPVFVRKDILNGRYIGRKPENYFFLAMLVTIVNPLLGPIAIVFAVMSDRAYYNGDAKYAQKWGEHAFTTSTFVFIISIIFYIIIGFTLSDIGVRGGHSY